MSRYAMTIRPHGSLFFGGYTAGEGKGATETARDAHGLMAPSAAVKGAIREAALRLVRGMGEDDGWVYLIFGDKGMPAGDDDRHDAGKIRFSPFYLHADSVQSRTSARHHVSLERATRQSADQRLFTTHVTPAADAVELRGELEVLEALDDEEWALLRSAVATADQIGGGRGRGLGHVTITLADTPIDTSEAPPTLVVPKLEDFREIILSFDVVEPLQLGVVKDLSNLEPTSDVLTGSTVRGAVAAVLARSTPDADKDAVLERVFGGETPVQFGDGLPAVGGVSAPLTLLESKGDGPAIDRAVDLCVEALEMGGDGRPGDMKSASGCWYPHPENDRWCEATLPKRTITRAARNPMDGRAKDGQLYSVEVIDPAWDGPTEYPQPLQFHVPVRGPVDAVERVIDAARRGLLVGGTRTTGFGRITLASVAESTFPPIEERHRRWIDALVSRDVPAQIAGQTAALLTHGFLGMNQTRLRHVLSDHGLEVLGGEARRCMHGGWNTRVNLPRTAVGGFVAGSVFLLRAVDPESSPEDILERLRTIEHRGLGPGRADGWGRVTVCHPIHLDTLPSILTTPRS